MATKLSQAEFFEKAIAVHGDKFSYANCIFEGVGKKVVITCSSHGDFTPRAADFLSGSGCRKCQDVTRNAGNRIPYKAFVELARRTHGDIFEYPEDSYRAFHSKTKIVCGEHGEFWQTPVNHTKHGYSCPKCTGRGWDHSDFLTRVATVHGDRYDYSQSSFTLATNDIIVTCREHGDFSQAAHYHIAGAGCRKCATEANEITEKTFLERAKERHGDLYDYSKTVYNKYLEKVDILCRKHGTFRQYPIRHVRNGYGCPKCPSSYSKPHEKLVEYIRDLGFIEGRDFLINDRTAIGPKELDIYFPEKKLGIEINGVYWHSTNEVEALHVFKHRHLNKRNLCRAVDITLMQVTDTEILGRFTLIGSIVAAALGVSLHKVFARKCLLREVSKVEARVFLEENHLQGNTAASIYLGLYSTEGVLIQLMTFGKPRFNREYSYELIRLCSKKNTKVIGGSARLFRYFVNNYLKEAEKVISYCDTRVFQGEVYEKLGFSLLRETKPNYVYLDKCCNLAGGRLKFQKHKLSRILTSFDSNLTESQNMFANGYRIMFDCGNSVWEYHK